MFWGDYGNPSGVYRAGMDGSNKITIAEGGEDIVFPSGLAIDYECKMILLLGKAFLWHIGTVKTCISLCICLARSDFKRDNP